MQQRYIVRDDSDSDLDVSDLSDYDADDEYSYSSNEEWEELPLEMTDTWHPNPDDKTDNTDYFLSEISSTLIISRLNISATIALSCTCNGLAITIHKLLPVVRLFEFISKNESNKTIELMGKNPAEMLHAIARVDINGNYQQLSPLQFGLKLQDTRILRHFFNQIKNDIVLLSLFVAQCKIYLDDFEYSFDFEYSPNTFKNRNDRNGLINCLFDLNVQACFAELAQVENFFLRTLALDIFNYHLDEQRRDHVSPSWQDTFTFFKNHLALLDAVRTADWNQVNKISKKNPDLIFEKFNCKMNGVLVKISPLQYSCMVYDTYSRRILFESIKDNSDYVKLLMQQESEVPFYLNLQPLFSTYDNYTIMRNGYVAGQIAAEEFKTAVAQLSKMQHDLLPWHLLRKMANPKFNWSFDNPLELTDLEEAFHYKCSVEKTTGKHSIHTMNEINAELAKGCALQRGFAETAVLFDSEKFVVTNDRILIECLYEQGKKEYREDMLALKSMTYPKLNYV